MLAELEICLCFVSFRFVSFRLLFCNQTWERAISFSPVFGDVKIKPLPPQGSPCVPCNTVRLGGLWWKIQWALLYSWVFSECNACVYRLIHGRMTSDKLVSLQTCMSGQHLRKRATFSLWSYRNKRRHDYDAINVYLECSVRFSKCFFFLCVCCHITNHVMTDPSGKQWILFCFPRISVSLDFFSGNKIHCFPRNQSLSV